MNIKCNETENLKIVSKYYNEIINVKVNLINYLNYYNNKTKDYLKELIYLQKKYANNLQKYENNQDCDISDLFTLTKQIPGLIKEKIGALTFLTDFLTKSINEVNIRFEENNHIIKTIEQDYKDLFSDLENKNKNIELLKNRFYSKAKETENLLIDNQKRKKIIKLNHLKDLNMIKEIINKKQKLIDESIIEMQNAEEKYTKSLPNINNIEQSFISSIESFKNTKIVILCSNADILKDATQNFLIHFQNYSKMSCVSQDVELREIAELKLGNLFNEKIEKNKIISKPFTKTKLEPYKMFLLEKHKQQLFSSDLYKDLSSIEIDDNDIYEIANIIYSNLTLKNPNYNLKIEKEKVITNKIANKILAFSNKEINLDLPDDDELIQINKLMESKYNREIFIQKLNEFRNQGIFLIPEKNFNIIAQIFNSMLNKVIDDSDFNCAKNCIILSQTYYMNNNNDKSKIFLQSKIKNNNLFKSKLFWDDFTLYTIQVGITESINNNICDKSIYTDDIQKFDKIIFAQLIPLADNMIEFGLDKEIIKELINPKIEYYQLSEESKNLIWDLLDRKKI